MMPRGQLRQRSFSDIGSEDGRNAPFAAVQQQAIPRGQRVHHHLADETGRSCHQNTQGQISSGGKAVIE